MVSKQGEKALSVICKNCKKMKMFQNLGKSRLTLGTFISCVSGEQNLCVVIQRESHSRVRPLTEACESQVSPK